MINKRTLLNFEFWHIPRNAVYLHRNWISSSTEAEYCPIWVPSGQSDVTHMGAHFEKNAWFTLLLFIYERLTFSCWVTYKLHLGCIWARFDLAVDHLGWVMVSSGLMSATLAEYWPIWVPSGQSGVAHMGAHFEKAWFTLHLFIYERLTFSCFILKIG